MKYLYLLLLFPALLHSQISIKGVVKDAETQKALPFASISVTGEKTFADVDGKFEVSIPEKELVTISYIGRHAAIFSGDDPAYYYQIYLKKSKPAASAFKPRRRDHIKCFKALRRQ